MTLRSTLACRVARLHKVSVQNANYSDPIVHNAASFEAVRYYGFEERVLHTYNKDQSGDIEGKTEEPEQY